MYTLRQEIASEFPLNGAESIRCHTFYMSISIVNFSLACNILNINIFFNMVTIIY